MDRNRTHMKPYYLLACLIILLSIGKSNAQITEAEKTILNHKKDSVEGWKTGGTFAVNLSQTALSNWAAGGVNSIAVNSFLQVYAHKNKNNYWPTSI